MLTNQLLLSETMLLSEVVQLKWNAGTWRIMDISFVSNGAAKYWIALIVTGGLLAHLELNVSEQFSSTGKGLV